MLARAGRTSRGAPTQTLFEHAPFQELELSRVGLIDRRIRRSVELMHAQLDQDLSLKEIAAASYLSPFHFVRVFKKLTGTTPHAYLAGIRTAAPNYYSPTESFGNRN